MMFSFWKKALLWVWIVASQTYTHFIIAVTTCSVLREELGVRVRVRVRDLAA